MSTHEKLYLNASLTKIMADDIHHSVHFSSIWMQMREFTTLTPTLMADATSEAEYAHLLRNHLYRFMHPCYHSCRLSIGINHGSDSSPVDNLAIKTPLTLSCTCLGQRNRQRLVPVPVTGVRYNSLL